MEKKVLGQHIEKCAEHTDRREQKTGKEGAVFVCLFVLLFAFFIQITSDSECV